MKPFTQLPELLVQTGVLSAAQVEQLLQEQQRWGGRLTHLLVEQGMVPEQQLVQLFHRELRFPIISLDRMRHIPMDVLKRVPVALCEAHDVLPVACEPHNRRLRVAMSDPTDAKALKALQDASGMQVEPLVAAVSSIRWAIRVYFYGEQADTGDVVASPPSSFGGAPPSASRPLTYGSSAEVPRPNLSPSNTGWTQQVGSGGMAQSNHWSSGGYSQTPPGTGAFPYITKGQPLAGVPPHPPHRSQTPLGPGYTGSHAQTGAAPLPQASAVATTKNTSEQRLVNTLRELQQLRAEFSVYKASSEREIAELQELVTSRFHEHRLMMRGLFDLLVDRGYLSKDEIIQMLSALNQP